MKIDEIIALAEIIRHIERENIREGIISDSMTTSVTTPQGWMVEIPNWDEIQMCIRDRRHTHRRSLGMRSGFHSPVGAPTR